MSEQTPEDEIEEPVQYAPEPEDDEGQDPDGSGDFDPEVNA